MQYSNESKPKIRATQERVIELLANEHGFTNELFTINDNGIYHKPTRVRITWHEMRNRKGRRSPWTGRLYCDVGDERIHCRKHYGFDVERIARRFAETIRDASHKMMVRETVGVVTERDQRRFDRIFRRHCDDSPMGEHGWSEYKKIPAGDFSVSSKFRVSWQRGTDPVGNVDLTLHNLNEDQLKRVLAALA